MEAKSTQDDPMTNTSPQVLEDLSASTPDGPPQPYTVLLIEDNEDQMLLVKYALDECGQGLYQLMWESRMSQGKERLAKGGVDVVLLDLGLPGFSGSASYDAIRAAAPDVPVVVLTSDDRKQTEFMVMTCGAEDYLVKDEISPAHLLRSIRGAIYRHKRRGPSPPTPSRPSGYTIGFVGTKGGVGVTSTVLNLAAVLAPERSTIAIETAVGRGGFAQHLRPDIQPASVPYMGERTPSRNDSDWAVPTCLGARVLNEPLAGCEGTPAAVAQIREILHRAATQADFVLVDAGSQLDPVAQAVLAECQAIVLVVDREPASLAAVRDWSQRLMETGPAGRDFFIVLVDRSGFGTSSVLEQASFARPILGVIPHAGDRIVWALERQRPIAYLDSGDAVSTAVSEVAGRLTEQAAAYAASASVQCA
jgi:CheY-like chemotaxis protein